MLNGYYKIKKVNRKAFSVSKTFNTRTTVSTYSSNMSGERKLYGFRPSPPSRAVLLTLKALDLDFTFVTVNTIEGDHLKPEFIAKNPQHTVPTLEETDGTYLWDSHAISAYLVRKYGKDDSLYPKDFYQRAVVDQRLHFENSGLFFGCFINILRPLSQGTVTKAEYEEKIAKVYETYDLLEKFLGDNQYMAGSSLTIADFSIVTNVLSLKYLAPVDADKLPKLDAWLERMAKLPYFAEANTAMGSEIFETIINEMLPLLK